MERFAREDFADTASPASVVDLQLSVPEPRQPPPFVAAPLAASAVPPSTATNRAKRQGHSGQLGEDRDRALSRIGDCCSISEIGPPVVLQQLSEPWQRLASLQPFEGAYRQHP
jgi:hypothetical protein